MNGKLHTQLGLLTCVAAVMVVSACGGGGSGGGTSPTVPSPTYQSLTSTDSSTSDLAGSAIRSATSFDVTTASGTLTHNTGAMTLDDGTHSTDENGISAGSGFSGSYDYVAAYTQSYTSGAVSYTSNGVYGVVTNSGDMPSSGTATYTGEARGTIVTVAQGYDLNSGTSTVNVDFAAGQADVTMNGFTVTDQSTGNAATAPIDTISATGMTISGNGFSGGTITTYNGGVVTSITGTNTSSAAQGHFFGYDAGNAIPDETAGNILITGDSAQVFGTFIAD